MSSLSVGIVGLPNVGKSTLFNALLKRQAALVANYPFATIEPNVGVVDVPDERLDLLCQYVRNDYPRTDKQIPEKIVPSIIKFFDIAGLVKGASQGEGLGNEFLGHIRNVSAVAHVVRDFPDNNVIRSGSTNPLSDVDVVNMELILSDLQLMDKLMVRIEKDVRVEKSKEITKKLEVAKKIKENLEKGILALDINLDDEEKELVKELNLITLKPMIYILNVCEEELKQKLAQKIVIRGSGAIVICAKTEADLSDFNEKEREDYLSSLGVKETGLDKLIKRCYELLGLECYLTMGPKEVHSWTIKKGSRAPQAAGEIHTDFERGFISAEVINFETLKPFESLRKAKDAGLVRLEGKSYIVKDGDIIEFNFSV
ncbi:redox-regulated ATPase YchF [candidate division WWE3 bacterium]|uniref:Ribosome-binding ATPase YchF n=1 Tax=candidate division WWE3 bacterium TaxID=2053526 RepID=A0A7X9HSP7_UNCKA|nr:redox-regulated ATPase YchF [candidate division WWE3 bacterium]